MPNCDVLPYSLQRLIDDLCEAGFDAAYDHFISAPALPFILLSRSASSNLFADDKVYKKINRWRLFLNTELKSSDTEKAVEKVLSDNGICFEVVDEFYTKEERLYQTIYEFEEMEG